MTINGMRPVHPGEILREEYLVPLDMTPNALSKKLGVTASRINEIVKEQRGITPETALRLSRFFGGDAQSWMNLQTIYDLKIAQKETMKRILKEVIPLTGANDERFALGA